MNGSFDPRDPLEAMTSAWAKPGEPHEPPTTNGAASWTEPDNKPIKLHDAGDIDVTKIPPRGWLLGVSFCRKFISGLVAEGGGGKTAIRYAQYIAAGSGHSRITGECVHIRCRVLIVCLEDDLDEVRRRISAALLHHKVDPEDI